MGPRALFRPVFRAAVLAAVQAAVLWAAPAAATDPALTIGTGSPAGVYFQAGRALCQVAAGAGLPCQANVSAGSIDNLRDLRAGSLQLAIAQSDWQYYAWNGRDRFADDTPDTELRALFSLHGEAFTLIARRDAGVTHLQDLAGKRVNIGNPGSGQRGTMEIVMHQMGWDPATFSQTEELPASEQSLALCHNRVQAMVYVVGFPNESVDQAMRLCESVVVEVSGRPIRNLVARYPFYSAMLIPGGLYPGNPRDVATFGVTATLVTSARLDADTVYRFTKAVFENLESLRKTHPAFRNLSPERMITDGLTAPLHDGALRYYRERGWL